MERTKTQIEQSIETFRRKTEEMQTANRIITGLQRWLDTGNDAYLKNIILHAAWLYTRDDAKAQDTVKALDRIKDMSR
jgi:uncharacterized protein (DUF934 family)